MTCPHGHSTRHAARPKAASSPSGPPCIKSSANPGTRACWATERVFRLDVEIVFVAVSLQGSARRVTAYPASSTRKKAMLCCSSSACPARFSEVEVICSVADAFCCVTWSSCAAPG